jgi:hypothetical protein
MAFQGRGHATAPGSRGRASGLARGLEPAEFHRGAGISGAVVSLCDGLGLVGVSSDSAIAFSRNNGR